LAVPDVAAKQDLSPESFLRFVPRYPCQLFLLKAITAARTMMVEKPRRNSPSMGRG